MAFFQFGRKLDFTKEYSLDEIPVFAALSSNEQKLIEKKARLVEFKRGDIVFQEGAPADAFYVIVAGRFRLFTKSKAHNAGTTLAYLYRGDHFGETSLLMNRPHSLSIEAKRNGLVLRLEKEDFLKLIQDIPSISLHLNRSLGHRLTKKDNEERRHEIKLVALNACSTSPEAVQFWLDFAVALVEETKRKVVLVDFAQELHPKMMEAFQKSSVPSFNLLEVDPYEGSNVKSSAIEHPQGYHYLHAPTKGVEDKDEKKIATLLAFLAYRYDHILLRLPGEINHVSFKALRQSDSVLIYCDSNSSELNACANLAKELQQSFGFSPSEILILIPDDRGVNRLTFTEKENILGLRIFAQVPSKTDRQDRYQATLRYLAKEQAGSLIGLALGSGAAYGLAHIGVLRVLEQEGITVDVVAGSSIGALIGALWAGGYDANALETIAKSIDKKNGFFKLIGFQDFSIAHRGFLKGEQVARFIESYLGDKTFQDLRIPTKVVAANLFTSEEVVFESGRVADAIRASISIPGIFRPVHYQKQHLIDGGVVDPLPVRVLSGMGVKKIIAVNVLPGPRDRIARNRIQEESRRQWLSSLAEKNLWNRIMAKGLDQVYNRYAVNIFNVIMSTIQFMEFEIAEIWGQQADVLIHPIVQEAHWAEFYSSEKFIKAGEEKTREQLGEIKRLLAE